MGIQRDQRLGLEHRRIPPPGANHVQAAIARRNLIKTAMAPCWSSRFWYWVGKLEGDSDRIAQGNPQEAA